MMKTSRLVHFVGGAELNDLHCQLAVVPSTTCVELQKQYLDAVETLLDTRGEAKPHQP